MNARILLIERNLTLAKRIEQALQGPCYQLHITTDGIVGLTAVQQFQPHLIILNWSLPGLSGLDLCQRLRGMGNTAQIILLNENPEIGDRVAGLDAGADDYLLTPFSGEEFLARLRSRLRRVPRNHNDPTVEFQDLRLNGETREVYRGDRAIALTAKEFDLLHYLMVHPRQVLGRNQILDRVWQDEFQGTSNIVEVYIRYLRRKLEAQRETRLIHTVHCVGYVLRESKAQSSIGAH